MASQANARALEYLANSNGKSSILHGIYIYVVTYIELRDRYNSVCALCLVFVVIISSLIHYMHKQINKHFS